MDLHDSFDHLTHNFMKDFMLLESKVSLKTRVLQWRWHDDSAIWLNEMNTKQFIRMFFYPVPSQDSEYSSIGINNFFSFDGY